MKVLVIDDEKQLADSVALILQKEGHAAAAAYGGAEGLAAAKATQPELVLCDLHLPDADGLELVPQFLALAPEAKVVVMTGDSGTSVAVEAMRQGAEAYLQKPFHNNELLVLVQKLGQRRHTERSLKDLRAAHTRDALERLRIYVGAGMQAVYEELSLAAEQGGVTVLIQGETGSGKEHAARLVHQLSRDFAGPFVELNCASIPETLVESELFGVEAGAFTDAKHRRSGLFEAAQGGTLFLDEVDELSAGTQAKLLKVLEDRELRRVGSAETVRLHLRVLAASNKDLEGEVKAGRFRPDLYYRLGLFKVRLPPLRERRSDIPALARHLFNAACRAYGRRLAPLSDREMELLGRRDWMGNVRELRNVIEHAVLHGRDGHAVFMAGLGEPGAEGAGPLTDGHGTGLRPLKEAVDEAVRGVKLRMLRQALSQADGNKMEAARLLGVDYKTILNLQRSLGSGA